MTNPTTPVQQQRVAPQSPSTPQAPQPIARFVTMVPQVTPTNQPTLAAAHAPVRVRRRVVRVRRLGAEKLGAPLARTLFPAGSKKRGPGGASCRNEVLKRTRRDQGPDDNASTITVACS